MKSQDDHQETRKFEGVVIESIKTTARLDFQDSMQLYLGNWLSLGRTDQEKDAIYARAGKLLIECGRPGWAAELSDSLPSSGPVPTDKEEHPSPPARKPTLEDYQGYITPDGLILFDDYLDAKRRFLEFQNFMYGQYLDQGNREEADFRLELMLKLAYFPGEYALYWLKKGGLMERDRNYSAAAEAYRKGLEYVQNDPRLNYFLRNNLGYSLNQLGLFTEGESWCRKAIKVDPDRANAHKNLGLALQGQRRFPEAAESFKNAAVTNPFDRRAFNHLRELLETHPDLGITHPEYGEFLDNSS